MDIEKVIKSLKYFRDRDSWREGIMIHDDHAEVRKRICDNAIALLKEQEEREKAICKGICNFIRGSCSTDTYEDKEYVCHVIQQMFIKGRSAK